MCVGVCVTCMCVLNSFRPKTRRLFQIANQSDIHLYISISIHVYNVVELSIVEGLKSEYLCNICQQCNVQVMDFNAKYAK